MEAMFMQVFERQRAAEAEMKRQVDSYSHILASALLVAGHLPPPWLLPQPAALARRESVDARMKKEVDSYSQSLACTLLAAGYQAPPWLFPPFADAATQDLVNPESADCVHHSLPEINQIEQEPLKGVGIKPGILNIASSSEEFNHHHKGASETTVDYITIHSSNEDLPPASPVEVPHPAVNFLPQNDTLNSLVADFCEVPHPIASPPPEKEITYAAETDSNDVSPMAASVLSNESHSAVKPHFVQGSGNARASLPENDGIGPTEHGSLGVPHSTACFQFEKGTRHLDEASFHEGTNSIASLLPDKELTSARNESHIAVKQGSGSAGSSLPENDGIESADNDSLDATHSTSYCHEGPNSVASLSLKKELTSADSLENPCLISSPLLGKDILHCVHPNSHDRQYFVHSLLDTKTIHAAESVSLEGRNPVSTQMLENDSSHSDNLKFLEGPGFVSSQITQKHAIETTENVSIEIQHCTTSVLQLEEDTLYSGEAGSLEGAIPMASSLPERESTSTDSLEVQHGMPSRLLDEEAGHISGTTSGDGPFCLLSPKHEMHLRQTIEHTIRSRKKSNVLHKCSGDSSRIHGQQTSGCHVQSASIDGSALQSAQLVKITAEANDVCVWNNKDASVWSQSSSSASSKTSRVLHTAERYSTVSTDKCLTGAEGEVNNVMEINGDLCATVADNQTKSSPSSAHDLLCKLGSSEIFSPFKLVIQETNLVGGLLLEKEPRLTCLLDKPHPITSPLLEKATLNCVKSDLLDEPYSVPCLQLDMEAGHTSEVDSLKEPYLLVSPQLEKDPLVIAEHTEILRKRSYLDRRINESSNIIEQQSSGCDMPGAAFSDFSLQPAQLPNTTLEAPEMLGMQHVNLLEDNCRRFSHPYENVLKNGSGRCSHSQPGTLGRCSLDKSAADVEKLLPKSTNDCNVCQNSIVPEINHSYSNIDTPTDAIIHEESESTRMQLSLDKTHMECAETGTAADGHMLSAALFTSNESLQKGSVLDSIQFQAEQSYRSQPNISIRTEACDSSFRNKMDRSAMLSASTGASNKCAGTKMCFTTSGSLQRGPVAHSVKWQTEQNKSPGPSEHSLHSYSGEMLSSLVSDLHITANHMDSSCDNLAMNYQPDDIIYGSPSTMSTSSQENEDDIHLLVKAPPCQSDEVLYGSSSTMSTSSSLANQSESNEQMGNRENIFGNSLSSLCYLGRLRPHECISPLFEESSNSNKWARPVTHEVETAVNCKPELNVGNLSDAIVCNYPNIQCSLCGYSNLSSGATTIHQHAESYSLRNNCDTVNSLTSCSYFSSVDDRCYMKQENSCIEHPNGDLKIVRDDYHTRCNETMQECRSFNISVPSKSPTIKDRAFQALCETKKMVNLSLSVSAKYKMELLDGLYQSLEYKFEKLMNQSPANSVKLESSYDTMKSGIQGKYSSKLDGALFMSDADSIQVKDHNGIHLTPSVEKYNMERLSGKTGSVSNCLGSTQELACFKIDEDSSIADEMNNQEKFSGYFGRNHSSQSLAGKKWHGHPTSLYHSKETGSLDLKARKGYIRERDHPLHAGVNHAIKNHRENQAPSIKKVGKVTQQLHGRLIKAEISCSQSERYKSEAELEKGCIPSNIITNISSFIPLVTKQKKQHPTSCVKKDVKVRTLKAAEAAKRREEKKKNEREKHKAAVELERERLKQEKDDRRNQVVVRKRQRDDGGKKEKDRKKRCGEEARKQQKQLVEKMRLLKPEKDTRLKFTDGKDPVLVSGVKSQVTSDEKMESVHRAVSSESNYLKAVVPDQKSESFELQKNLSDVVDKSYAMSPYEDSDEDELEHKQEVRRRKKLIPSWTLKESLDKILLSNQSLDPWEIFVRKCSFVLSDVLATDIPQRRVN